MSKPYAVVFFLLFLPFALSAQLSGKVLDEKGQPLAYATVYVRNSGNGVSANAEGGFKLKVAPGRHEIVFQYIGYKQKIEVVEIGDKPITLTVRMEPDEMLLTEVEIRDEDPAYRIMREVIARRKYYRYTPENYSFDAYMKGFHRLMSAPKKLMGRDLGNLGGILDSTRSGVIYLSESVSKVYIRDKQKKEIMISSKVSGDDNGFSFNSVTGTEFSLYNERLDVTREILSPLADNAFAYYDFKLRGKFTNLIGHKIYKIAVIPRRKADPVFGGHLYIVDEQYNLSGADLYLTGDAIKQPALDTLNIRQEFFPIGPKSDVWPLLNQVMIFKFGILGFNIQGLFNTVYSNYQIDPTLENNFFNREIFRIEKGANERDATYWNTIRPIPLTEVETRDYTRKDSLQRIWQSKAFKDSIDRKGNKFGFMDPLFGYTWNNSWKRVSVSWPPLLEGFQFNTVQGYTLNVQPRYRKSADDRDTRFFEAGGVINYGFSEKKWRGGASLRRRFESIHYTMVEVGGGLQTEQFSPEKPIGPGLNSVYTLFLKQNYLKIYEKAFGRADFSRRFGRGLQLRAGVEYAERRPLENTTEYSLNKKSTRFYTSNNPVSSADPIPEGPIFRTHQALLFSVEATFRIKEKYSTYPDFRSYEPSKWPIFSLKYVKAAAGVAGSDADFDFLMARVRKNDLSWGLAGYTGFQVSAGVFPNRRRLDFMDFYHPMGNQTIIGKSENYTRAFFLLPYYAYSTNQGFFEAHWQHHFDGFILEKIPLLRKLNWKETLGAAFYYTDRAPVDPAFSGKMPYWEFNVGFENIGFGALRPFRIDVATGFFGKARYRTGVVIGIGL
jgi:Family of unknown function (DUF5686)/CarboxypepD_reg-like domain